MLYHPVTDDYAPMTPGEFKALKADIKANGLKIPIVRWRGQIVDGKHRCKACKQLGIRPRYWNLSDSKSEAQMRTYVASLNEKRRSHIVPLTTEEKRQRIMKELKANRDLSARQIAAKLGVDKNTVIAAKRRAGEIHQAGEIHRPKHKTAAARRKTDPFDSREVQAWIAAPFEDGKRSGSGGGPEGLDNEEMPTADDPKEQRIDYLKEDLNLKLIFLELEYSDLGLQMIPPSQQSSGEQ
jgi:hypothetical protein